MDERQGYLLYMDDGKQHRNKMEQYVVTVGNFTEQTSSLSVRIGKKCLNVKNVLHSFTTFVV